MVTIQVIDRATPELEALTKRASNPIPGLLIAGRAVSNLLRAHYRTKHTTEPNKLGGERQNFWLQVARSVNAPRPSGNDQVTVAISHPAIRQKIEGGTITAKRAKFLTIPVDPRAYGRRASVLEQELGVHLFLRARGDRAYLAARTGEGSKAPIRVFYALKKSVTQAPDPTALPPQADMENTVTKYFGEWLSRTGGKP